MLTLVLPAFPSYDVTAAESLAIVLPSDCLRSRQSIVVRPTLAISASEPQVVLGGSLLTPSGLTEDALATPVELHLVISLLGATWLDESAWRDPENQQKVLDALRSTQPTLPFGWHATVSPVLFPENVHFIDGTTLSVTIRQAATYSISESETLTLTLPSTVVRTVTTPLAAEPSLVIRAATGRAVLNGSLLSSLDEATLAGELQVQLLDDEWGLCSEGCEFTSNGHCDDGGPGSVTALCERYTDCADCGAGDLGPLVRLGFRAAQLEARGFNNVIRPLLSVERRSSSLLAVTVPQVDAYDISFPETLSFNLPPQLLRSAGKVASQPELQIVPSAGTAVLSDASSPGALYLYRSFSEEGVRAKQTIDLQIKLTGDKWSRDVGEDSNASVLVIRGLNALSDEQAGWNAVVQRTLRYTDLRRLDDVTLRILIPQSADYDITAPETIAVLVPAEAVLSAASPTLTAAGPAGALIINASEGSATLSGTLLANANGASIQSPEENTLLIGLKDVDFNEFLLGSDTLKTLLAQSCSAAETSTDGWNNIVRKGLTHEHLSVLDRRTARLRIPQFAAYQIVSPETISVIIPAETLAFGSPLTARPSFIIEAPQAGGLFGGTLLRNVGEDELRSTANYTLSVTLSGDEWADTIGADGDDAATATFLSNLVATSSSPTGWNAIVRGSLGADSVQIDRSLQQVLILFPSYPSYEIAEPETITLTLPSSSVKSGNRVFVSPSFRIRASSGGAVISGRALARVTEEDIRRDTGSPITFNIKLDNDTYSPFVGHRFVDSAATQTLLEGVRSAQSEAAGWNRVVLPVLKLKNVARYSTTEVTVTLPRVPLYDISAPETISVSLPPISISSGQRILATPSFVIEANAGLASLGIMESDVNAPAQAGTQQLDDGGKEGVLTEATLRSLVPTRLILRVVNDEWQPTLGMRTGIAVTEALLASLRVEEDLSMTSRNVHGWNSIVGPGLVYSDLSRLNASTLIVTVPQFAA